MLCVGHAVQSDDESYAKQGAQAAAIPTHPTQHTLHMWTHTMLENTTLSYTMLAARTRAMEVSSAYVGRK